MTIGIERTSQAITQPPIALWVIDQTVANQQIIELSDKVIPLCENKQLIIILNKSDLKIPAASIAAINFPGNVHTLSLSAKNKEGLDKLQNLLVEVTDFSSISQTDIIVTNIRHYESLVTARASIRRVKKGLISNLSTDFISQDLRECIYHLSDIMGEVTTNEVLSNIFSHFCIGK